MKSLTLFTLLIGMSLPCHGRPVPEPTVSELMSRSQLVAIITPKSVRLTSDKPDDQSFPYPDLSRYQALETTCAVSLVMKGEIKTDSIKLVHFGYAGNKPDFNGAVFMAFLLDPVRFLTFPSEGAVKPDTSRVVPYAQGTPEYLAFLRRLPDGRYAAVGSQYDAALSFRLLSTPWYSDRYDSRHVAPGK